MLTFDDYVATITEQDQIDFCTANNLDFAIVGNTDGLFKQMYTQYEVDSTV